MMNSGKQKKLTVMTKTMNGKKPNLQIDTNHEQQPPKQQNLAQIPHEDPQAKGIAILPSPVNVKALQNTNDVAEGEVQQGKKGMQKKNSQKQQLTFPKPQLQPKISANLAATGFVSPKAAFNKDRILISYTSQKNVGLGSKTGPKDLQRDSKAVKIEQLEKIIEESKIRQSELSQKESTLQNQREKLEAENAELKAENSDLKKKIEKYKITNEQTKKMLKQRIHSYNEQGGELQQLRNQIKTLQQRVQSLLSENLTLKAELNKFSDFNMKDMGVSHLGSQALVVSSVREVPLQSSRVSQLYLRESAEPDLLEFNDFDNMEQNLDLESYISEAEQSYLEQYKSNVEIFDKIKQQYDQIMVDIEVRFKVLADELKQVIKSQASQIYGLQNKIDELQSQRQQRTIGKLSLQLNEIILRNQKEIAELNLNVYDLRESNKELTQNLQHHRAQCRFLEAELDIERMKKRFKNENDKFQFNVVKLNLLNIIDKLKMQIDREKTRFTKLHQKYTATTHKKQTKV